MRKAVGDLSESQARAVEMHLASCERCTAEYDEIAEASCLLRAAREPSREPSPDLWDRIEARLADGGGAVQTAPVCRRPWRLALGGASLAAILAIGVYLTSSTAPPVTGGRAATSPIPRDVLTDHKPGAAPAAPRMDRLAKRVSVEPGVPSEPAKTVRVRRMVRRSEPAAHPERVASIADSLASSPAPTDGNRHPAPAVGSHSRPAAVFSDAVRSNFAFASPAARPPRAYSAPVARPGERLRASVLDGIDGISPARAPAASVPRTHTSTVAGKSETKDRADAVEMVYSSPDARARAIFCY